MVKQRLIILAAVLGLSWIRLSLAAQETLTIQTYYPAPYGAYDQLTTAGNTYLATDSGSVGIGTMGPTAPFHIVSGNAAGTNGILLENTNNDIAGLQIKMYHNSASPANGDILGYLTYSGKNSVGAYRDYGIIRVVSDDVVSGSEDSSFRFDNFIAGVETTNVMVIKGGNLGIGEVAPGSKLSVSGGATIGASYDTTAAPSNGMIIEGNVGIGTTGPVNKLNVVGTNVAAASSGTAENGAIRAAGTGGTSVVVDTGVSGDGYGWIQARDYTSYATRYSLLLNPTGGNVGIGTQNPQGKLDVNGSIYQRGSSLHADYVFEPEYGLESIEEHSEYMWREKHLKAVPRAQKDEGGNDMVEYGSRNRGVLEELEKAHVYIQQLNERIKLLEARLSESE